jgi:hypothetical protein
MFKTCPVLWFARHEAEGSDCYAYEIYTKAK